jgi:NADH pyrophosphatase NudC (nudix superfamily)
MSLDPHILGLVASTVCTALLMALSGIDKSLLDWKNGRRHCPSCGRQLRSGCICR